MKTPYNSSIPNNAIYRNSPNYPNSTNNLNMFPGSMPDYTAVGSNLNTCAGLGQIGLESQWAKVSLFFLQVTFIKIFVIIITSILRAYLLDWLDYLN